MPSSKELRRQIPKEVPIENIKLARRTDLWRSQRGAHPDLSDEQFYLLHYHSFENKIARM